MFESKTTVDQRAVRCATRPCEGTRYRLQAGEILGRTKMPGRQVVERSCLCDECQAESVLKIQVRIPRTDG